MDGPFNILGAYTQACGVELQLLAGVPVTVLTQNFLATDTEVHTQSTLGFPPSGYFNIAGEVVYYTGKTVTKFTGLIYDHLFHIPDQTLIVSMTRRIEPSSYELFWSYPWVGNDYDVEL